MKNLLFKLYMLQKDEQIYALFLSKQHINFDIKTD